MSERPAPVPSTSHDTHRARFARAVHSGLRTRVLVLMRGHRIWQVVADATFASLAWWLAFFVRFDNGTPPYYERAMFATIGWVALINLTLFAIGRQGCVGRVVDRLRAPRSSSGCQSERRARRGTWARASTTPRVARFER